jgi:hypothetical protein
VTERDWKQACALCICLCVCLYMRFSVCVFVSRERRTNAVCVSVCLSVCLSVHVPSCVSPSVCVCVCAYNAVSPLSQDRRAGVLSLKSLARDYQLVRAHTRTRQCVCERERERDGSYTRRGTGARELIHTDRHTHVHRHTH